MPRCDDAFELGKRGFAAYVLKVPTYKAVYGAFAAFPVFLLWVYFSWLVTLTAALITANLARVQPRPGRGSTSARAGSPKTGPTIKRKF
jgi:membrane protein